MGQRMPKKHSHKETKTAAQDMESFGHLFHQIVQTQKYSLVPVIRPLLLLLQSCKILFFYIELFIITPLPAQISASNFHDLTQITLCAVWSWC